MVDGPATTGWGNSLVTRQLLDRYPGMVYRCRLADEPTMLDVSAGARDLTGFAPDDLVGNRRLAYQSLIYEHDRERVRRVIEAAAVDGQPFQVVYRIQTASHQNKWVWEHGQRVAGDGTLIEGFVQDITALMSSREALERERTLLEESQQLANVGTWIWYPGSDEVIWSRQMHVIFGHGDVDTPLSQSSIFEYIHPDDRAHVGNVLEQAIATGESMDFRYRIVRADGAIRVLHGRGRVDRGEDGVVVRLIGTGQDVTDREASDAALRESQRRLEEAQRIGRVGSWTWDIAADQSTVSSEVLRLLGVEDADFVPSLRSFLEHIHPEDVGEFMATMQRVTEARLTSSQSQFRVIRRDGSIRTFHAVSEWQYDAAGHATRASGTLQDVTDQRGLEDQLRQSQKMEAIGRLAGGIAHDFNNLLLVMRGHADLLTSDLPADDPAQADLQEVIRAADRGAELTRQLLTFSRRRVVHPQRVDLSAVVKGANNMLRRLVGEDIELSTAYAGVETPVLADPGQLEQVLVNLVVNARDAMPRGGRLAIATAPAIVDAAVHEQYPELRPGQYVVLTVSDTGHGMSAAIRSHIFEPFFTTKEPGQGTGLGLATVFGIVRQADGHILVYSEEGRGTTFKVYLPQAGADAATAVPQQPAATDVSGGGEVILLVEDEEKVRQFMRRALEGRGYRVIAEQSATDALAAADGHQGAIDLLLTDVVLPGINGRDLADELRVRRPDLRIMFMSGYTPDVLIHHRLTESGAPFLEKPFSAHDLAAAVRKALEGRV